MIPPQYSYKLASGWNMPSGSLQNIEAIRPNGGQYFYAPSAFSSYDPGTSRIRMDGQVYNTGYPSVDWKFDTLFRDQYQYFQSNYCTGGVGFSGKVTVQTLNTAGTYVPYNAIVILPNLAQLERNFTVYRNVTIKFTRLEEIS